MKVKQSDVLFEDNHLIAINKPSGVLVQGDKTRDTPLSDLTKDFVRIKYQKSGEAYLGVPHRLDRPTSGIVLFAKTSKALVRLNKMFQEKEMQKTYWAICKNKPEQSNMLLKNYLVRYPEKNKSISYDNERPNSKYAELEFSIILSLDNYHLLEVFPKTGRHHQIRSQLSKINCPIKGDVKYGFDRTNKDASIHLHARKLEFIHPVSKEQIVIIAPPPAKEPLWKVCVRELEN